nr:alpha-galactosidase 3 [Tanacetum cinerariifolium]
MKLTQFEQELQRARQHEHLHFKSMGEDDHALWAGDVGNSWITINDIEDTWPRCEYVRNGDSFVRVGFLTLDETNGPGKLKDPGPAMQVDKLANL